MCCKQRGVAQFGRALGSGPRGRKFKSSHSDQNKKDRRRRSFLFFVGVRGLSRLRRKNCSMSKKPINEAKTARTKPPGNSSELPRQRKFVGTFKSSLVQMPIEKIARRSFLFCVEVRGLSRFRNQSLLDKQPLLWYTDCIKTKEV